MNNHDNRDECFECIFKKSYSISYNAEYICCVGTGVTIYDINGKLIVSFNGIRHPVFSKLIDNMLIVKTAKGLYYLYDLKSMSYVRKLCPPPQINGATTNFFVSFDHRFIIDIAEFFPYCQLMVMNIETGEYHLYDLNSARYCQIVCDKSTETFYVLAEKNREVNNSPENRYMDCYVFDFNQKEVQLYNHFLTVNDFQHADYHNGQLVIGGCTDEIVFLNVHTGYIERCHYDRNGVLYGLQWSGNGKYLVLAESEHIIIFDVNAKKCIKTIPVKNGCYAAFYDNDTKLLIGTWQKGFCVPLHF